MEKEKEIVSEEEEVTKNKKYTFVHYEKDPSIVSDFASDDIVCAYKTEDDLINSFRFRDRTAEKSNINYFWEMSYKIVYGANVAISMADIKGDDPVTNQLKGESYFLRAYATHNLVRFFAKPYNDANKQEPGVILRDDKADKTDQSAQAHGHSGNQGRGSESQMADQRYVKSNQGGVFVVEAKQVQARAKPNQDRQSGQHDRQAKPQKPGILGCHNITHQPENGSLNLVCLCD